MQTGSDDVSPCKTWLDNWSISLLFVNGMSIFVSGMNFGLRTFTKLFVQFERKHTITKELASAIGKMWFIQFFNTGIIIFLINANYQKLFNTGEGGLILAGKYSDFSGDWYGQVGAAVAITTFITSVFPAINISKFFVTKFKRCCDRGFFSCDAHKTRQMLQVKYNEMYYGPQFEL